MDLWSLCSASGLSPVCSFLTDWVTVEGAQRDYARDRFSTWNNNKPLDKMSGKRTQILDAVSADSTFACRHRKAGKQTAEPTSNFQHCTSGGK